MSDAIEPPARWAGKRLLEEIFTRPPLLVFRAASSRIGTIVLLLAAFLVRLWAARHAYFADDESLYWATSLDIAQGRAFPLVGLPVSGSPAGLPGPLLFWLVAPVLWISPHPLAGSAFFAALNVIGLYLFARVVRLCWGRRAAAVILIIGIASPWLVPYADRIWAGNLFFFLCALTLYLSHRMVRRERSRAAAALGLIVVVGPQLHLSTVHLALIAAVLLLVHRARIHWKWLVAGAAVGAALYAPYVWHELTTDFANTRALMQHAPGGPRSLDRAAGLYLHLLGFGTVDIAYLFARGYWYGFDHFAFWRGHGIEAISDIYRRIGAGGLLWAVHLASWIASLAGLVVIAVRAVVRRRLDFLTVGLVTALIDVGVLYAASGKYGYAHYVTIIAPFGLLPAVAALAAVFRRRITALLALGYLAAFTATGGAILRHYYLGLESCAAEQLRIIQAVFREVPRDEPFEIGYLSPWMFPAAYERLAPRIEGRPWTSTPGVARRYLIGPRAAADGAPPGIEPALQLEHLSLLRAPRQ